MVQDQATEKKPHVMNARFRQDGTSTRGAEDENEEDVTNENGFVTSYQSNEAAFMLTRESLVTFAHLRADTLRHESSE